MGAALTGGLTRLLTVLTRGGRGLVRCTTWLSGPADASPWTGCTGPRWTGHVPKRYGVILAARLDLTAPERVRVIPAAAPRLRRGRHGRRWLCSLLRWPRAQNDDGENRKMEKLTVSLTVGVAASVRPLKARLMAAAIWREREGAGEGEIDQNVTKNQRWRYLWSRGTTAEL